MIGRIEKSEMLARAIGRLKTGRVVSLSGVWGSAAPFLAAAMARATGRVLLYVCPHLDDADDQADDMELFWELPREDGGPVGVVPAAKLFPAWENNAAGEQISDEIAAQRLDVCTALRRQRGRDNQRECVIVAPVTALLQPVPNEDTLAGSRLYLQVGAQQDPDALADWLVSAGFEPADMVEGLGEFARRGGIVDILPAGETEAVRVEFFGDQIDSIRRFDLDSQRSNDRIESYELLAPAAGREIRSGKTTNLLSYLPGDAIVCLADAVEVATMAEAFYGRLSDTTGLFSPELIFAALQKFATVETHPFTAPADDTLNFAMQSLQGLVGQVEEVMAGFSRLSESADVTVFCENAAEQHRLAELMESQGTGLSDRVLTSIGHLNHGFYWPGERLAVVGHHELFQRYAKRRRLRRVRAGRPIDSFIDLEVGDYVVHVAHGVARFEGLRSLEEEAGRRQEYLSLRFADNAMLHVPSSQVSLVQKYIGAKRHRPKLSKLGGATWRRQRDRVAEAVRDLAADMLRIQAVRDSTVGQTYRPDTDWQRQFEQEFPYTETADQISCLTEIKSDLTRPRPMDRLLCGDVGFGKTELAVRAAFKVTEQGKQVALLVPTTVLAAQHMRTFAERLADYPFTVEVLSRFRSQADQQRIVKAVAAGKIDVLIGTHRLLSEDIRFADLGLVIIDEEQRFGVAHKERLKAMRATVDVLTMTATPIPRTLHMALMGLRDISNLTTPPLDRRAIHTEICQYDEGVINAGIVRELNRQGQVFFLHNRVHGIEKVAADIRRLVRDARVTVAHGQMPAGQLERVMLAFVQQEYDVLVCTTIIESGLDIPTANTIFINHADRFGLAELHQLRGRVGRYKHRAHCYLLLSAGRSISPVAAKRLKAVQDFSDLGAGFQIAMRDLEIRGAGNILGAEQSGHIADVGYELYCRLLEQAVGELRGEKAPPRKDVNVDLGLSAYIPRSYIPSDRQRMEVYRRIARCGISEEMAQLQADMRDVYGKIPPAADTLLEQAEVRILAGRHGIDSIVLKGPDIVFTFGDPKWREVRDVFAGAAGSVRLPDDRTVHWRPPANYLQLPTLLRVLQKQLKKPPGGGKASG
ncbi:MAG: transcription-repair coupling factor [Planctomycetes bacterium]|nr:transcription-repair coupling factor [Planctomycetota bacterium]